MDMEAIRTFVAIARARSFSRAARTIRRSQPAISRRISLLEQELGAPLFERLRDGTVLTDAGAALLPYAEAAMAAVKDGAAAVRALQNPHVGSISLALVGTLANAALAHTLREFTRQYPKVHLRIQTATSREVSELVRQGDATLGIRYFNDDSTDLISKTLTVDKIVVVCAPDHRLADGRRHTPQDLKSERWVAFPSRKSRESIAEFLEERLRAANVDNYEIIAIDSLSAQKRLVEAGFGIALLAESAIEEELRRATLCVVNVPALRITIPVNVIHRRTGYLNPAAQNLLATIERSV